jgi:hypothetical protein
MAAVEKSYVPRNRPGVEKGSGPNQVLSRWKDLEKIGLPRSSFHERLRDINSMEPDSVCVNEGICMEYGHFCHTIQRDPILNNLQQSTGVTTGDSKIVANDTFEPLTLRVELESVHTRGVSVAVTQESDVSFNKEIPLHLVPSGTREFVCSQPLSIQNTAGYTCSNSEKVQVTESVDVTLQPGQKAMAVLDVTWTEVKGQFAIPFAIDGWCMSTFPRLVNGQRVWLHEISGLFDIPQSMLRGNFTCVYDVRGSVDIQLM